MLCRGRTGRTSHERGPRDGIMEVGVRPCVAHPEARMCIITNQELPLFSLFRPVFTVATFARAQLLGIAAILTPGRRTLANLLRTVAELTEGDPSSYHRVLSLARWSALS